MIRKSDNHQKSSLAEGKTCGEATSRKERLVEEQHRGREDLWNRYAHFFHKIIPFNWIFFTENGKEIFALLQISIANPKQLRGNFSNANFVQGLVHFDILPTLIIFSRKYMIPISILQDCLKPICFVSLSLVLGYSIYIANLALLSAGMPRSLKNITQGVL